MSFWKTLFGQIVGQQVTQIGNTAQALQFGREFGDEWCDVGHDLVKAGTLTDETVAAALAQFREVEHAYDTFIKLERLQVERGETQEIKDALALARDGVEEGLRNVVRALTGQPLWTPPG